MNIPLSKGYAATVSSEDYPELSRHRWHAVVKKRGRYVYAARWVSAGKRLYMHRAIAGVDGLLVDHIDGNTLDNRRENLRAVDHSANSINQHTPPRALCGVRGVTAARTRFRAQLRRHGRMVHLGCFDTVSEAAAAVAAHNAGGPA